MQLGDICNTYFGIQAFDRNSSIDETKKSNNYLPIIDGEDIHPFSYAEPSKYFDYRHKNIKTCKDI